MSQEGMERVCRGREMKNKVCEDVFDVQTDGKQGLFVCLRIVIT